MIYGHPDIFMFSHEKKTKKQRINIMSDIIIEVYQAIIGMHHIKGASSDSNCFKIMNKYLVNFSWQMELNHFKHNGILYKLSNSLLCQQIHRRPFIM